MLGAGLPATLQPAGHGNPAGHWEPARLVELNDECLAEAGSAWYDCRPLDLSRLPRQRREYYADRITSVIREEYGSASLLVLKDPRICRLLPIYHDALDRLGIRALHLMVARHPVSVAASLQRRDRMLPEYGQLLWLRYVLDAERLSRRRPRSRLDSGAVLRDWQIETSRIAAELSICWPSEPRTVADQVAAYLDPDRFTTATPPGATTDGSSPIGTIAEGVYRALVASPASPLDQRLFTRAEQYLARADEAIDAVYRELKRRETVQREAHGDSIAVISRSLRAAELEAARHSSTAVDLGLRLERAVQAGETARQRAEALSVTNARLAAEVASYGARIGRALTRARRQLAPSGSIRHKALQWSLAGLERLRHAPLVPRGVTPELDTAPPRKAGTPAAPAPTARPATAPPATRRAYVVAAHYPSGGGRMLYGIAEALATELGAEVVVVNVGGEAHAPDRFSYPLALPSIDLEGYRAAAREDDLLVMSPAFSHLWLGRTAPRRKLMYLQHFNTFRMLDTFFTDYVCVSRHTSDMLRATYGIRAEVIPACIEPVAESPPAWSARPERRVLVNLKGDRALNGQLLEEIRSGLAARGLEPEFVDPVQGGVQHAELMRTLGSHRFLLTLTDSEGFGLLPLEAMARGVAVTGFDGFGGREYMRHGRNSLCHPFPRVDRVIDSLALLMTDERRARTIAAAGQKTAQSYSAQRFRAAWRGLLTRLVSARSATQQN